MGNFKLRYFDKGGYMSHVSASAKAQAAQAHLKGIAREVRISELTNKLNFATLNNLNASTQKELVLYHPDYWFVNSEWAKNLLLFSDGICLLIPEEIQPKIIGQNEYLLSALLDNDLIQILKPEQVVSKVFTQKLKEAVELALKSGLFAESMDSGSSFIHFSRLGYASDFESANWIFEELKKFDLIEKHDRSFYRINERVYCFIVGYLAHLISASNLKEGFSIYPVTDNPSAVQDFNTLAAQLSGDKRNSFYHKGDVMMFDFQMVGVDLSNMPIDEILDYRKENQAQYMNYIRTVRKFLREINYVSPEERIMAFQDREIEISYMANELRKISRKAWGKPANFALTIAGAAISLVTQNPLPAAILSSAAAISGLFGKERSENMELYAYVFNLPRYK